jgi:hypothetical protein
MAQVTFFAESVDNTDTTATIVPIWGADPEAPYHYITHRTNKPSSISIGITDTIYTNWTNAVNLVIRVNSTNNGTVSITLAKSNFSLMLSPVAPANEARYYYISNSPGLFFYANDYYWVTFNFSGAPGAAVAGTIGFIVYY